MHTFNSSRCRKGVDCYLGIWRGKLQEPHRNITGLSPRGSADHEVLGLRSSAWAWPGLGLKSYAPGWVQLPTSYQQTPRGSHNAACFRRDCPLYMADPPDPGRGDIKVRCPNAPRRQDSCIEQEHAEISRCIVVSQRYPS